MLPRARRSRVLAVGMALAFAGSTMRSASAQDTQPTAHVVTPPEYVDQAIGVIERNSFYARTVDMPAIRKRAMERAESAQTIAATYPIIDDAIKATHDKHALFRPPATQTLVSQGKAEGYGLVGVWPARLVVILSNGGPAEAVGIKLGDRIDLVNGRAPRHNDTEVVFPKDESEVVLPQVVVKLTRGRRSLTVTIRRGQVSTVNTPAARVAPTPPGSSLKGRVGYIDLPGLIGDPGAQAAFAAKAQALLAALDGSARCGWVVDLRRNKGGYIAAMLAGIAPLISDSTISSRVAADGSQVSWTYQSGELRQSDQTELRVSPAITLPNGSRPVAVLTSALTASAAEAAELAFAGRANARTFGEPTYGLTSYTVLSVLHDGASLTVTNALDVDAAGRKYDGPVQPDEPVAVDWAQVATVSDPVLGAALRWLGRQPGCTS